MYCPIACPCTDITVCVECEWYTFREEYDDESPEVPEDKEGR